MQQIFCEDTKRKTCNCWLNAKVMCVVFFMYRAKVSNGIACCVALLNGWEGTSADRTLIATAKKR